MWQFTLDDDCLGVVFVCQSHGEAGFEPDPFLSSAGLVVDEGFTGLKEWSVECDLLLFRLGVLKVEEAVDDGFGCSG